ncbi:metallopeptidase family M24-domain-containing protein [Durotheca rogersii]|uniref:metallopeptidase family M24-domain-containing protein n=1 Tax=Durotheca rogersii TaxID=419775 RepID=UPI00221E7C8B|nr:metallopeptidase family M24-domain-containing protein [Durotheca rogersii]KAI5863245.1 metallopeptidase family M24-domain-containing protein [Durotheca rogersii]
MSINHSVNLPYLLNLFPPYQMDSSSQRRRLRDLPTILVLAMGAVLSSLPLTQVCRSFVDVNVADPAKDEPPRKYPAKLHARKVAEALGVENGIIYLPGQLESTWEDSDLGPPFRQRRYFFYLSGISFPGCSITYDIAADKLTLWVPYTPPATVLWFGTTPTPEDCLALSDVHDAKYASELPAYLNARLPTAGTLYALRPAQLPKFEGFDQMRPLLKVDTASLQPAMDDARVIKTEHEVAMIRRACEVTAAAHRKVATLAYGMKNECEIEAAFVAACTAQNAHVQSYPVIAGAGANASTLHYEANSAPLAGKYLAVIDGGAEWSCYASDVTRTLPLGSRSRFSAEARAIYDLVHRMQDECIKLVRPGVLFRDLQLHATMVAVEGLLKLGVLRGGTAEEIFRNGTGAAFFPHGLGHHVGLDVHDVLSKDLLRPAGEGMWGKRRPIGPQSVRAMIKQADSDAAAAAAATSSPSSPRPGPASSRAPSPPSRSSASSPAPPPLPRRASASSVSSSPTRRPALNGKPSFSTMHGVVGGILSHHSNHNPNPSSSHIPNNSNNNGSSINGNGHAASPSPSAPPLPSRKLQEKLLRSARTYRNVSAAITPSNAAGSANGSSAGTGKKFPPRARLEPGMAVTVEPGIYFCRQYIEAYFLGREEHARYIDAAALERFWAVGGARVEDVVLVTADGAEVLTAAAPKGDALLKLMGFG